MLGAGRAVAPAVSVVHSELQQHAQERRAATASRHVARERARDLQMAPQELLAELARYVDADELALVQARLDSGQLPLEWLDDLVHHRRAAFWSDDAAA